MTNLRDIYKCTLCGHVVEVAKEGAPTLVCCGKQMVKLEAKTADTGKEKHVPVVSDIANGVRVVVGSVEHPMEEKHYIKFIEVLTADKVLRAELKAGMKPAAEFLVNKNDIVGVREYCTVHDLWKA
ncbi:MAG TPA: desulfoferrodoxin [Candidatus Omnitrophota bacterium]|nr:desulfoferrodoxin [Candidatus Omnitrophota bacterium]HPS20342.1 desulfoferrodoxin [Candidatus Omnitrophota bacterium]